MKSKTELTDELSRQIALENKGFRRAQDLSEFYENLYEKNNDDSILYIHFRIEKNRLYIIGGWLRIKLVESILTPLLEKYSFSEISTATLSSSKFLPLNDDLHSILNQAQAKELITQSDIHQVAELMWQYINGVFIPFFEKYSNLQTINDEIIEKAPDSKITDYIPSYASFKKMIIMKICHNPNYEEYRDWLSVGLKKRYEEGRNKSYYLLLLELIDILKKY